MRTLATYNMKGGVGKTTTAVNLAHLASGEGRRVLVWDLDPQGAASFFFRVKTRRKAGRKLIRGKRGLDDAIKATDHENLDLVPADLSFRNLELLLNAAGEPTHRLADLLAPVAGEYDLVILDCAPNLSLSAESVFEASDALMVPLIPTTLSLRTYEQFMAFREEGGTSRAHVLPFFCMADRRRRLQRELIDGTLAEHDEFLRTVVPYSTDVERMGPMRAPVTAFAPRSAGAVAYRELWREIADRLGR